MDRARVFISNSPAPRLITRERFFLRPGDDSLFPLTRPFPSAYFASCYLITARIGAGDSCWNKVRDLSSPDVLVGASRLVEAGWSIKILARDSVALRGAVESLRAILSAVLAPLRSVPRIP